MQEDGLLEKLEKSSAFLPLYCFEGLNDLLEKLGEQIINPAEIKLTEIRSYNIP